MRTRRLWTWLLACGIGPAACGGSGQLDGSVYHGRRVAYEIGQLGGGWQQVAVETGNDAAWIHDGLASIVQVNASCNPELDIPLEALTNHLLIGFTDRDYRTQDRVPMAAREALRTHVRAKLDGVPRELILQVLKKDGCVYDFALIAPPDDRFDRALQAYESLLAGFATRSRNR